MNKILGLDLGVNSIRWAHIDNDKVLESGLSIFPSNSFKTRTERRLSRLNLQKPSNGENKYVDKSNLIIYSLITVSITTGILTLVNNSSWQYWMNLSLTIFVSLLALIYFKDK